MPLNYSCLVPGLGLSAACHMSLHQLLSHAPAARCHMSPRRPVTCPRSDLSCGNAACCHFSPQRAAACPSGVLSHVPAACCHIALNRVLTLPDCRSRRQLSESVFRSQKGPLGVELWSFYCKKRISVPMSILTFFKVNLPIQGRMQIFA